MICRMLLDGLFLDKEDDPFRFQNHVYNFSSEFNLLRDKAGVRRAIGLLLPCLDSKGLHVEVGQNLRRKHRCD